MAKLLTTDEFIRRAKEVHGDKYSYNQTEYKRQRNKVVITCPEHGDFKQLARKHLEGQGCPMCAIENKSKKQLSSTESFIEKAKAVHGDCYDYSLVNYIGAKKNVKIICPKHGPFLKSPHHHLQGQGCPKCSAEQELKRKTKTIDQFIKEARKVHANKYDYSDVDYKAGSIPVAIICREHGMFWQRPDEHLRGKGCPACSESKLEKEVRKMLEESCINFETEKTFSWLINNETNAHLFLDFYLADKNLAIECQGEQHFKPVDFFGGKETLKKQKKLDKLKNTLCKKNGIKVIYFSSKEFEKIGIITDIKELLKQIEN